MALFTRFDVGSTQPSIAIKSLSIGKTLFRNLEFVAGNSAPLVAACMGSEARHNDVSIVRRVKISCIVISLCFDLKYSPKRLGQGKEL